MEIVRRIYDAVARGDNATVLAAYDAEVEFDFSRSRLAGRDTGRAMSEERQWPSDWRSRVEALADALNARDFEAVGRAPLESELEWRSVLAASEGGSYRGVEGLRQWSENVNEIWDAFRLELSELHEADEGRTVTVYRITGRAKASGVPLDARLALVWTWRRGKVCGIVSYTNPAEALEAVGLRE